MCDELPDHGGLQNVSNLALKAYAVRAMFGEYSRWSCLGK